MRLCAYRCAPRPWPEATRDSRTQISHLWQREEQWTIVDLAGKAAHTRTVPTPERVKERMDKWLKSGGITSGKNIPPSQSGRPDLG
jgi:hypothetical protein